MKKVLILLMLLIPFCVEAKKKKVKREIVYSYYLEDPLNTKDRYFDDGKIYVSFNWSATSNTYLNVTIRNKTDARISIEWQNARIGIHHIYFNGDDNDYSIIPQPDEVIHAGEVVYKTINDRYYSSSYYYNNPIFDLKYLYNEGDSTTRTIIIPVKFGDKVVDYKFTLVAYIYKIYIIEKKK